MWRNTSPRFVALTIGFGPLVGALSDWALCQQSLNYLDRTYLIVDVKTLDYDVRDQFSDCGNRLLLLRLWHTATDQHHVETFAFGKVNRALHCVTAFSGVTSGRENAEHISSMGGMLANY